MRADIVASLGSIAIVDWMDHIEGVYLTFEEITRSFSIVVAPLYTPTSNVWEFQLLHILNLTLYGQVVVFKS